MPNDCKCIDTHSLGCDNQALHSIWANQEYGEQKYNNWILANIDSGVAVCVS